MLSYTRQWYQQLYQPTGIASAKYYPGLNGAKGLLILMVVFTHCLPPGMILYFMYFFHMPLFMALSGFLLKQSAFQNGYKAYLKRMWHKLIIPWLIASLIFIPFKLTDVSNGHLNFIDIIYPYYHLWYIPSYIIGASVCYCMVKWKIPSWPVIILFAVITAVWYNVYRDTHVSLTELPLYWVGDKRLFAYLFFFIIAFCLRNQLLQVRFSPLHLLFLKAFTFIVLAFLVLKNFSSLYVVWPYMLFNLCLVFFVLVYVAPQKVLQNKLFLWANEQSLGIYLYHPLVITSIYILLHDRYQKNISYIGSLGVFVIAVSITLGLVFFLKKWSFTAKYFLGNIER